MSDAKQALGGLAIEIAEGVFQDVKQMAVQIITRSEAFDLLMESNNGELPSLEDWEQAKQNVAEAT